jgi:iron complex transport system substrate-binding protein
MMTQSREPFRALIPIGLLVLALAGFLSGCVSSTPVEEVEPMPDVEVVQATATEAPSPTEAPLVLVDGLEQSVVFESPPQRIISMAPSNTELLFAIGAEGQIVGRDEYSDFPPAALEVSSIGSTYGELNTEAIVAFEPDLVLVAAITPIEQIEALKELGLRVFQVPNPLSFDDLFAIISDLGLMTGHQAEADELVDALEERIAAVEQAVQDAPSVRVFYEVDGTDPTAPWTTGSGTFQQLLIEMVHGENIAADIAGWGSMNLEQIVERDPEVIIFAEGPWVPTTSESLADRSGWDGISAVVNSRVFGVDTNWVDRPGPRLVDALERFAEVIQSDDK